MKILFLGDASNFHNTLSGALNSMGHHTVVVSNGSEWMNTSRNIDILRKPGKIGSVKHLFKIASILPKFKGFDIVQIRNPIFLELRPRKIRYIFDYLKRNNRKICLSALGTDYYYVKSCLDGKTFRYSDFMTGNQPSAYALSQPDERDGWITGQMRKHTEYIINNIDGVIACLYEYYKSYENIVPGKLAYGGIPINTDTITPHYIDSEPEKVRFFIGIQRKRSLLKGTDLMLEALQNIHNRYPDKSEICIVENIPYKEYLTRMSESHVILDQLYSYTPSTNALLAMAKGIVAVSGAEPEYYNFIAERENHPIINVSPLIREDIEAKLEWIILNKHILPELSIKSREFVIRHNDYKIVAQRHLDFWNTLL